MSGSGRGCYRLSHLLKVAPALPVGYSLLVTVDLPGPHPRVVVDKFVSEVLPRHNDDRAMRPDSSTGPELAYARIPSSFVPKIPGPMAMGSRLSPLTCRMDATIVTRANSVEGRELGNAAKDEF